MALNTDRIGHRYPSYRYEVSREKIREYAAATGVEDAAYTDDSASDLVAPPTFAACFTIARGASWAADEELGIHPNLVHGSQEYIWHRAVRLGDVLECTPWIESITNRGRNDFLTVRIDCVDEAGEPVVTSRGTLVFFGDATPQEGS